MRTLLISLTALLVLGACASPTTSITAADSPPNNSPAATTPTSALGDLLNLKKTNNTEVDVTRLSNQVCVNMDKLARVARPVDPYNRRLLRLAQGMPAVVSHAPVNYKVYLTSDINAIALANGCVRVNSGLMDKVNDDELRSLIAHLIGHVTLGHTKVLMQSVFAATEISTMPSNLSAAQLTSFTEKFSAAQFTQPQEIAADNFVYEWLATKNIRRESLSNAFGKLGSLNMGKTPLHNAHLNSTTRTENMQKHVEPSK